MKWEVPRECRDLGFMEEVAVAVQYLIRKRSKKVRLKNGYSRDLPALACLYLVSMEKDWEGHGQPQESVERKVA